MYQQHATGFVAKILEGLRIGNIDVRAWCFAFVFQRRQS
jgi:hypothetical protein